MATFYVFKLTASDYLNRGVSIYYVYYVYITRQALTLYPNAHLIILSYIHEGHMQTRALEKEDSARITEKINQETDRFQNDMIHLKNWSIILYLSCALLLVSLGSLVSELAVFRKRHVTKVKIICNPK